MAGPGPDYIVVNPPANVWQQASQGYGIVANSGTSYTMETRTFNGSGVQTVYGNVATGVADLTTTGTATSPWFNNAFGCQDTFTLGNNGSDVLVPSGVVSVTLTGGAYIAVRVNSYTGRPALNLKVRRSGAWTYATAIKVRRSGAWVAAGLKVRRSSAWSTLG